MTLEFKRAYHVADPNAVWCAGKRVPEDRLLHLTPGEARYALLSGALEPADRGETSAERPARRSARKGIRG